MRFFIDNPLSPQLRDWLQSSGHDAVHVRDYGLAQASDEELFERAADEDRVVITSDTDFGAILAKRNTLKPSVVLFRREVAHNALDQFELLIANLTQIESYLLAGAIVVFDAGRVRVRNLPFAG